jgi:hypothetical protein
MSQQTQTTRRPGMVHWPVTYIIVGFLLIIIGVIATTVEIKTSEINIMGGTMALTVHGKAVISPSPDLGVLMQPVQLMQGKLSPVMVDAVMWAWILEVLYLTFVLGLGLIYTHIRSVNRALAFVFVTGTIGLIVWDCISNYNYTSLPSGQWAQLGVAIAISFAVAFFGIAGGICIEHGVSHW